MYLDYNATTPVDPRVLEKMLPYFYEQPANASSVNHASGRSLAAIVESSREDVASTIAAKPKDIIFTSGATESINIAIQGLVRYREQDGKHIICSAVEHRAVLSVYDALRENGWEVTILPVDADALVSVEDLQAAIRPDTILFSLIHANNETGQYSKPRAIWCYVCRARCQFSRGCCAELRQGRYRC